MNEDETVKCACSERPCVHCRISLEACVRAGMLTVYVSCTFFLACFLKLLYLLFCSPVNVATSFPHCLTSFPVPRSFEMEINHTGEYPEGASCYTQNVAFGTMFYCQDTGEISNFYCYRAWLHRSLG